MSEGRHITHWLHTLVPAPRTALAGAVIWGAAMGLCAFLSLSLAEWHSPPRMAGLVAVFTLGGALAFPLGHVLYRLLCRRDRFETRLAAALIGFAGATLATTAGLYALQYRIYYAQWHGEPLSREWTLHLVFTTIGALYQFAVLGARHYFPWGFAALLPLAWVYAAKLR